MFKNLSNLVLLEQGFINFFLRVGLLLFVSTGQVWAKDISLTIDGVKGELEENVDIYVSSIAKEEYSTSLRFQSRLRDKIASALKALGYYQPKIHFTVTEDNTALKVMVEQGDPVRIKQVNIELEGEAKKDPEFIALINNSELVENGILNHSHYDKLKSAIRNLALSKGYFDGDFTRSSLEVAPARYEAFIYLYYNSGDRYRFGKTRISGSQIEQEKVRSLTPYNEGDPYLASDVGLFNQRLSNTEWFSSVAVQPDIENVDEEKILAMDVALTPQSQNQIETGVGYSTDVGVRGTLKWNKPWVNQYGHSFDSNLSLSIPEQTMVFGYKIPLEDVLNEYYRLQYGMKYEDNLDTQSLEVNAVVERHWQLSSGWHRNLYLKYLHEDFTQGAQDDDIKMVIPGISFSRSETSGGGMPLSGNRYALTMEVSDKNLVSRARMYRFKLLTGWIGSIGSDHRGLARIGASANFTDDILDIPPSLRFFAGGDNNLRGYDYESISPTDDTGALIGAKYMATSSLEYQYRVKGNWWLATFVDVGDAWSSKLDPKTGTGFGVRWASPVGPIRLDFAWGLAMDAGDQFRIHFALGPEL